ncbi:hypothetical protein RIR_jg35491.t1 [Rhizophagus irregularis DAOM 181602=DAOM 197198]|nr:hypothetical protein RIR_jg35491.t1 [Rhizophagus irregularis DAOM 181602=DAOM 197198]
MCHLRILPNTEKQCQPYLWPEMVSTTRSRKARDNGFRVVNLRSSQYFKQSRRKEYRSRLYHNKDYADPRPLNDIFLTREKILPEVTLIPPISLPDHSVVVHPLPLSDHLITS